MTPIRIGLLFANRKNAMSMQAGSRRRFAHRAALSAILMTFSAAAAFAVQPRMTVLQLGSSACAGGYYYPTVDAAIKKVAFTSFCDLIHGGNTDGNGELFVMGVNGTGLTQLTSSVAESESSILKSVGMA